jgi:hypothetical protein
VLSYSLIDGAKGRSPIPRRGRVIGILENGFRDYAESLAVALAAIRVLANPMKWVRLQFIYAFALIASRAKEQALEGPRSPSADPIAAIPSCEMNNNQPIS